MKSKIKRLILLNSLFYINNYAYAIVKATSNMSTVIGAWSITPYIFIFITTFLLENPISKRDKRIKLLLWVEFIIRIAVIFINYTASVYNPTDRNFAIFIGLEFVLMIINIYIIIKVYNKVKEYIRINGKYEELLTSEESKKLIDDYYFEKKQYLYLGVDERNEVKRAYKTTSLTGFSLILLAIIYLGVTFFLRIGGEKFRNIFLAIDMCMLLGYFKLSSVQLRAFYKDIATYKKVLIRDNFILLAGMTFLFIMEGFVYINTHDINFVTYIIGTVGIIPTLNTNRTISLNFHKVNKDYIVNNDDQ
ncbi:hypothetical protein [Clostridium cellulovorans]|uniref:Uncharacterized protein n=1 Tax=Clostridium cellulovorans (strain ATCC 35296 / DSM 3052 / OCM 3 / 743B) TaxID=573061 RepID=D9SSC0_CLOC7|nr:hypothetical protein [Clostridium cellulovorans]ADL50517.1 hypothetical protein Clocel_0746 [Clostridium cellulovorans 743B]